MSEMTMNSAPPAEVAMRDQVTMALLDAINFLTRKSTMAEDTRQSADCAKAVLDLAQALIVLDPMVIAPQGVGPEVIARSAPPRPAESAKRKALNKTGPDGKVTRYEMEG